MTPESRLSLRSNSPRAGASQLLLCQNGVSFFGESLQRLGIAGILL